TSCGQGWTRAGRGGHALAHRYAGHGRTRFRDGRRELLSDLFWGLGVPLLALALLWPTRGLSLVLLGGYALLYARVRGRYRSQGLSHADAQLAARFIVYSKFAHVVGVATYALNRTRGEY